MLKGLGLHLAQVKDSGGSHALPLDFSLMPSPVLSFHLGLFPSSMAVAT